MSSESKSHRSSWSTRHVSKLLAFFLLAGLIVISFQVSGQENDSKPPSGDESLSGPPPGEGGDPMAGGPPSGGGRPPVPVNTAAVEEGSFAQPIRLTGSVEAYEMTQLATEVGGIVDVIYADEGDFVTKGTPLLALRQLPFELSVEQKQAEAAEEAARLEELRNGTRTEDLEVVRADYEQAKVAAEIAKAEFERYEQLLRDKTVSQSEYDEKRSAYVSAAARESVAKALYDKSMAGARREEIVAQEALTRGKTAEASLSVDQLERSTVRAPYDGYVTKRRVSVGAWVSTGTPLFEIQDLSRVKVTIMVPESYFNRIQLGAEMQVVFDAIPKRRFTGHVTQRIPSADDIRSRAFPVRIEVDNPDKLLADGMLARIVIDVSDENEKSVVVPKDAIVPMVPKPIVYRVMLRDGQAFAEPVEVDTGRFFGEAVEVFGALSAGEQVVIRGNERLIPMQPIELNSFPLSSKNGSRTFVDPEAFFDESNRVQE